MSIREGLNDLIPVNQFLNFEGFHDGSNLSEIEWQDSGSVGIVVVNPRILGCERTYARSHPKMRPTPWEILENQDSVFSTFSKIDPFLVNEIKGWIVDPIPNTHRALQLPAKPAFKTVHAPQTFGPV